MNQSPSYARKAHILTLLKSGNPVTVPSIVESLKKITLQDGTKLECVPKTVIRDIDGDPRVIPNALVNTQVVTRRDGALAARHEVSVEVRPALDLDVVGPELERVAAEALAKAGFQAADAPTPAGRGSPPAAGGASSPDSAGWAT